jgi:hypothetical protein
MANGGPIIDGNSQGDLVIDFDNEGRETHLPSWYVSRHVQQGYAVTAHRAQGSTVDFALTLVDDTWYRELGYSALSRGRHGAEIYLTGAEVPDPVEHHPAAAGPEPLTALTRQFERSRAEQAAISALPEPLDLGDPATARAAWDELDLLPARLNGYPRTAAEPTEPAETDMSSSNPARQRFRDQSPLRQLEGQLHYRERLLGVAVRYQRPHWADKLLGPVPTSRRGEASWLSAAGAVAAYAERWNAPDSPSTTDRPTDARQRHLHRVENAMRQLRQSKDSALSTAAGGPELHESLGPTSGSSRFVVPTR